LLVEFLDEFVYAGREAAWPLIRHDLDLQYVQIGLILGLPALVSTVVEPAIGLAGDTRWRRTVLTGGGIVFAAALATFAVSPAYLPLLIASLVMSPASGAAIGLSQATLIDERPADGERAMTLWTAAGGVGALAGTAGIGLLIATGIGWRPLFAFGAVAMLVGAIAVGWLTPRQPAGEDETHGWGWRQLIADLHRPIILRWLALLESANLLVDVLLGYLAIYLVTSGGATPTTAAFAIVLWTAASLAGNLVLMPLLARFDGLRYLRVSSFAALIAYPVFLVVPNLRVKIVLVVLVALINSAWYPVLKARLYAALPGRSGSVMALGALSDTIAAAIPVAVGVLAEHLGLPIALAFLTAGPLALFLGLPPGESPRRDP